MGVFHWLYDKTWKKLRRRPRQCAKPQIPPAVQRPPISQQLRNPQTQSPLFGSNFPAELRLMVYEAVLGDAERLMHVIHFRDGSNRVGRQRCEDVESNGPTWQHRCFGTYMTDNGNTLRRRHVFKTNDSFMAILLSCHRMYVLSPTALIKGYALLLIQLFRSAQHYVHSEPFQCKMRARHSRDAIRYPNAPVASNTPSERLNNVHGIRDRCYSTRDR